MTEKLSVKRTQSEQTPKHNPTKQTEGWTEPRQTTVSSVYILNMQSYTRQFFLQRATQRWRIKNLSSSCRGSITRLQLFSQLATRTITNKMADARSRRRLAKDELWLAHSDKIALQVAEGMLHASNLSRNVAKSRGSFYFSCNSQRNNCSCKMGCYTWIYSQLQLATQRLLRCKKNCFV